ncbi:4369_t:CDS:2, partial [Scutellospora calospora]
MVLISYMALNDIWDESKTPSSESPIIHNQLKSYNFKRGSGNVKGIATTYNNSSAYDAERRKATMAKNGLLFMRDYKIKRAIEQEAFFNSISYDNQPYYNENISAIISYMALNDIWDEFKTNFKCESGNLKEIAIYYNNSSTPTVAIGYIANADPDYNSPGNLQFLILSRGQFIIFGVILSKIQFQARLVQVHFIRYDRKQIYSMASHEFIEEKFKRVSNDVNFVSSYQVIAAYNGSQRDSTGMIKVWDINSRNKTCHNKQSISGSVSCLDISHDEKWITCGTTAELNKVGD